MPRSIFTVPVWPSAASSSTFWMRSSRRIAVPYSESANDVVDGGGGAGAVAPLTPGAGTLGVVTAG
ncbi:MAG TPA: hypothetical protein VGP77_07230 [Vicinamibacterales bacterium]|nr:hypothetical protein [Vicinamibacterales bacterium]